MASAQPCGIAYTPGHLAVVRETTKYLPLQGLQVHADIIEGSAIISLTQTFSPYVHRGLFNTPQGRPYDTRYVFSLPENAVVCEFEMRSGDRRVSVAAAQEKGQAMSSFVNAYNANSTAGLIEHISETAFSVALGNLPESQVVTTKLTYVADLSSPDFPDQVRLHLPLSYGQSLSSEIEAADKPANRISITANIRMKGAIQNIHSPSHPSMISTSLGSSLGDSEQLPAYSPESSASYSSPDFLTRDFVLAITAAHLTQPLCVAERHPSGSVAFRFSMVPELKLPPMAAPEYIFMLDRSASMTSAKLETAKKTLTLLLHALPSKGISLNIFSFGNDCDSLWEESVAYTQESLDVACKHVESMRANYGGTDIRGALTKVCASRKRGLPTICLMLTDGEVFENPTRTLETVEKEMAQSTLSQPLRIFTLGIGREASTDLCEAIARVGRGECLMATTTEDMVAKCARLIRNSRRAIVHSLVDDVSVDWTVPPSSGRPLFACCARKQAFQVQEGQRRELVSGVRFTGCALVNKSRFVIPKEVTVTVRVVGMQDVTRVVVPVEELPLMKESKPRSQFYLTHILAASDVIRRLEADDKDGLETKKQIIVLAKKYQLITRYTSLIAIDKKRSRGEHTAIATRSKNGWPISRPPMTSTSLWRGPRPSRHPSMRPPHNNLENKSTPKASYSPDEADEVENTVFQHEYMPTQDYAMYDPTIEPQEEYAVARRPPHATVQPPQQTAPFASSTTNPDSDSRARYHRAAVPQIRHASVAQSSREPHLYGLQDANSDGVDPKTMRLVCLQAFDGSFAVTPELESIVGRAAMDEHTRFNSSLPVPAHIWVTVLAMAYLHKHLTKQPDLLNALTEKATSFIGRSGDIPLEALLERANELLGVGPET
ncbi:von Willebrand factor type A domain-containing protein [Cytidiella melzeri]|nr:von Willebrand factor type A domain-containing protein [Cytidiella melzeri]